MRYVEVEYREETREVIYDENERTQLFHALIEFGIHTKYAYMYKLYRELGATGKYLLRAIPEGS